MEELPRRGPDVHDLGLPLPPARMRLLRKGRPLKRWRYVGVFGPELMVCAADARIGLLPVRWWAAAGPGGMLAERSGPRAGRGLVVDEGRLEIRAPGVHVGVELRPAGEPVEVASPSGRSFIWTRKRPCVARGHAELHGRRVEIDCGALVDESAGYHERRTAWHWSAGAGRAQGGEAVWWNLVRGVHDAPAASERTVWVDGAPVEVGPVEFAGDLSRVGAPGGPALDFSEWAVREEHLNLGVVESDYRQPFGSFTGALPSGLRLAEGYGVMERHDVRW